MKVLVVEDEAKLARLIRRGLERTGAVVDLAADAEGALWRAAAKPYDVIVLDVMLPGLDGFHVCRRLRAEGVKTPVLMLTARTAVTDRVAGLDSGADDYLGKPFAFDELLARLRALARRGPGDGRPLLDAGGLHIDPAARRVWRDGAEITLSAREFALLEAFVRRPGRVLSRLELLELGWDQGYENRSNVVDVTIRRLREKIDRPFGKRTLETVRGAGYRLCDD